MKEYIELVVKVEGKDVPTFVFTNQITHIQERDKNSVYIFLANSDQMIIQEHTKVYDLIKKIFHE